MLRADWNAQSARHHANDIALLEAWEGSRMACCIGSVGVTAAPYAKAEAAPSSHPRC
jgi:hypothetical protein